MISSLFSGWNQNKLLLVSGNILFGLILIMLGNSGVLPLDPVNFIFFSFVALLFALYRPGWAFLLFVGAIPYETISLAPVSYGISLRPYQGLAIIILLAVIIRFAARKLPFDLAVPRWFDWMLLLIPAGAFIAIANAPDAHAALKQAIVTLSFGVVYAVGRIFWQSFDDVKRSVPFFLGSSLVVCIYALWQNLRFLSGGASFEAMAGRPNATFSEADWLGLFMVIVLSMIYALMFQMFFPKKQEGISYPIYRISEWARKPDAWLAFVALIFSYITLIITVARSAWLGAAAAALVFVALVWRMSGWRRAAGISGIIGISAAAALIAVFLFPLTSFHIFDRAQSTASGLQQITIACEQDSTLPILPAKIRDTSELEAFHCRHIMLEEIDTERTAGRFITTMYRDDPNISIRKGIYAKAWEQIREHPIIGIGWGGIASVLGTDERGAGLNASNMFLEIWLGSGLVGFAAFVVFWFGIAAAAIRRFLSSTDMQGKALASFILSLWAGTTVFNLFNSGILLGFFFLYLALGAMILQETGHGS